MSQCNIQIPHCGNTSHGTTAGELESTHLNNGMSHKLIFIGNDALVTLTSLTDKLNGDTVISDATCTGELTLGTDSTAIDSFSLDADGTTEGRYEGTIPASVTTDLEENQSYKIRVTAVSDSSTYYGEINAIARYREYN